MFVLIYSSVAYLHYSLQRTANWSHDKWSQRLARKVWLDRRCKFVSSPAIQIGELQTTAGKHRIFYEMARAKRSWAIQCNSESFLRTIRHVCAPVHVLLLLCCFDLNDFNNSTGRSYQRDNEQKGCHAYFTNRRRKEFVISAVWSSQWRDYSRGMYLRDYCDCAKWRRHIVWNL